MPSSEASQKTVRRRSNELGCIRKRVSAGDSTSQLSNEILAAAKEERESLLTQLSKASHSIVSVSPTAGLALKADLQIPWNK